MITIDNLALWGTFLSGLGALSALIISIVQIKKNSKISEANFWLIVQLAKSSAANVPSVVILAHLLAGHYFIKSNSLC